MSEGTQIDAPTTPRRIRSLVDYCNEDGTRVELFAHEDRLGITITKTKRFRSQAMDPAKINWSGCGNDQSVGRAAEYARALGVAVQIAQDMDAGEFEPGPGH